MKRFLLIVSAVAFFGCDKEDDRCETWKVSNYCQPKDEQTFCSEPSETVDKFCGDELNGIYPGATRVVNENEYAISYVRFIEKLY